MHISNHRTTKMKKLCAILLLIAMTTALAVPAFAAEGTFTITAPDNGHTYEVYQIFTGSYSQGILSNVKWGQNGTGTEGEAVSSEIITELTGTTGNDTAKLAVISKYVNLESNEFGTVAAGGTLNVPAVTTSSRMWTAHWKARKMPTPTLL